MDAVTPGDTFASGQIVNQVVVSLLQKVVDDLGLDVSFFPERGAKTSYNISYRDGYRSYNMLRDAAPVMVDQGESTEDSDSSDDESDDSSSSSSNSKSDPRIRGGSGTPGFVSSMPDGPSLALAPARAHCQV